MIRILIISTFIIGLTSMAINAQEVEYNKGKWGFNRGGIDVRADSLASNHKKLKKFNAVKTSLLNQLQKTQSEAEHYNINKQPIKPSNIKYRKALLQKIERVKYEVEEARGFEELELDKLSMLAVELEECEIDTRKFKKSLSKVNRFTHIERDNQQISGKRPRHPKHLYNQKEKALSDSVKQHMDLIDGRGLGVLTNKYDETEKSYNELASKANASYIQGLLENYNPLEKIKQDSLPSLNRHTISQEFLPQLDSLNLKSERLMKVKARIKEVDKNISRLTFDEKRNLRNLFFEGTIGMIGQDFKNFSFSPLVGYNLNKFLSAGAGLTYNHKIDDSFGGKSTIGYNLMSRVDLAKQRIYLQAKNEFIIPAISYLNKEQKSNPRSDKSVLTFGLGARIIDFGKTTIVAQVDYSPLRNDSRRFTENVIFKVGFQKK
jgi:hypothetical protein